MVDQFKKFLESTTSKTEQADLVSEYALAVAVDNGSDGVKDPSWYVDSACTRTVSHDESKFKTLKPCPPVKFGWQTLEEARL